MSRINFENCLAKNDDEKQEKEYPENWDPIENKELTKEIIDGVKNNNIEKCKILAENAYPAAIEKLPLKEKLYFYFLREEPLPKEIKDWDVKEEEITEILTDLKSWSTEEFKIALAKQMGKYNLEDAPQKLREIFKEKAQNEYFLLELIKKIKSPYNPADFSEIRKAIRDSLFGNVCIALAEKMEDNYDFNECPEFKDIIEKKQGYRSMALRRIIAEKANPESIKNLPLTEKIYFWYFQKGIKGLKEELEKEYPNGWDPREEKLNKIICDILSASAKSIPDKEEFCLTLIEKMKEYDPAECPKILNMIKNDAISEKIRRALAEKVVSNKKEMFKRILEN